MATTAMTDLRIQSSVWGNAEVDLLIRTDMLDATTFNSPHYVQGTRSLDVTIHTFQIPDMATLFDTGLDFDEVVSI